MTIKQESSNCKRLATPIFVFDDYIDYLAAWYGYAKRFRLTQKLFMEMTGAGPQAYFSDILARRKKLALRHVPGFTAALRLSGDAAEFFSLLVQKEHAGLGAEKEQVLKQLSVLREKHLSVLITDANVEYFSSWKYPVVREYVVSKGFVKSLREIKRSFLHFSMSLDDVRKTVNKLIQWKMVAVDREREGFIPGPGNGTISYHGMPHSVVNDVKRLFIESSVHAMETLPKDKRHITMALRGMSRSRYELFCKKIDGLRREFLTDEEQCGDAEYVYGLNVQLFPLMSIHCSDVDSAPDTTDTKE